MTIAFVSFENQTGDKSYDNLQTSIPSLLTASLDESKFFRVMTWDRIRGLLTGMGKGNPEFIDKETGLELCRRAGVHALGVGTFTKAGNLFLPTSRSWMSIAARLDAIASAQMVTASRVS